MVIVVALAGGPQEAMCKGQGLEQDRWVCLEKPQRHPHQQQVKLTAGFCCEERLLAASTLQWRNFTAKLISRDTSVWTGFFDTSEFGLTSISMSSAVLKSLKSEENMSLCSSRLTLGLNC